MTTVRDSNRLVSILPRYVVNSGVEIATWGSLNNNWRIQMEDASGFGVGAVSDYY